MARDYYDVLEINRSATQEDIKRAFRKQALRYHPDRNKAAGATEQFKEVSEAYQILSDPERKQIYDKFGYEGLANAKNGGNGFEGFGTFGGFGDIFDAFFGGTFTRKKKGADIELRLSLELKDVVFGVNRVLKVSKLEQCVHCNGEGASPNSEKERCPSCKGSGEVRRMQRTIFGKFQQVSECSTCGGEGQRALHKCKECAGIGRARRDRQVKLQIPPGIEDGVRIRLERQGEAGERGASAGDLYVLINVKEDPLFMRDGQNVVVTKEIDFSQAALGADVEVPKVDGKKGMLKIPAGTQGGATFRFKGAGIPVLNRQDRRGDQIVVIKVVVPSKLTTEQRKLIEALAETFLNDSNDKRTGGFFRRKK